MLKNTTLEDQLYRQRKLSGKNLLHEMFSLGLMDTSTVRPVGGFFTFMMHAGFPPTEDAI